jgi:hypothetical protein
MQSEEEISEIVQHKVRHAVGRRGLQEIHQLIDRWHEEEEADRKLWRATLIGLLLVALAIVLWLAFHSPREVIVVDGNDTTKQKAVAN